MGPTINLSAGHGTVVNQRRRAGAIDSFGVGIVRKWGLGAVLEGDPVPQDEGGFFIDGQAAPMDRPVDTEHDGDGGMFVPPPTKESSASRSPAPR